MAFSADLRRIESISSLQIYVSVVFWGWAVLNVVTGKQPFDGGIIVFVFSLVAGIIGLESVKSTGDRRRLLAERHLRYTIVGHSLVTICYICGAIGATSENYVIYACTFAFLWAVTGLVFNNWIKQWIKKVVVTNKKC